MRTLGLFSMACAMIHSELVCSYGLHSRPQYLLAECSSLSKGTDLNYWLHEPNFRQDNALMSTDPNVDDPMVTIRYAYEQTIPRSPFFVDLFFYTNDTDQTVSSTKRFYTHFDNAARVDFSLNTDYTRPLFEWRSGLQIRKISKLKTALNKNLPPVGHWERDFFEEGKDTKAPFRATFINPNNQTQLLRLFAYIYNGDMIDAYTPYFQEATLMEVQQEERGISLTDLIPFERKGEDDDEISRANQERKRRKSLIPWRALGSTVNKWLRRVKRRRFSEDPLSFPVRSTRTIGKAYIRTHVHRPLLGLDFQAIQ
jgi:hypothetical protein